MRGAIGRGGVTPNAPSPGSPLGVTVPFHHHPMIVTDISSKFNPQQIVGPSEEAGMIRSPGLHVSQIYYDIELTVRANSREPMEEKELFFYRAGGFVWERIFSMALAQGHVAGKAPGDIVRPGELEIDGITGSPDGFDLKTGRVIETKGTWKSSRKFDHLEKYFWVWLVQQKGYCKYLGTTEAELYSFHMMGDYRGSGPLPRAALLQFSKFEIEENWNMLRNHARKRGWIK